MQFKIYFAPILCYMVKKHSFYLSIYNLIGQSSKKRKERKNVWRKKERERKEIDNTMFKKYYS